MNRGALRNRALVTPSVRTTVQGRRPGVARALSAFRLPAEHAGRIGAAATLAVAPGVAAGAAEPACRLPA